MSSKPETKVSQTFECQYCHRVYVREVAYLNHTCKQKERIDQLQSPLGQASYLFYAKWMRSCGKSIPSITTFLNSKFYESFIRFAKFNKSVKLPSIDLYIQIMVKRDIGPHLWTDDRAYSIYLEHMAYHVDPKESVKITSETLEKLSSEYECEISDVLVKCNSNEVIQLIRERRLSPWILLKSPRFKSFLKSCTNNQLEIIETLIDYDYWSRRFKENPKVSKFMNLCVEELGL